jgi:hypothetical protein
MTDMYSRTFSRTSDAVMRCAKCPANITHVMKRELIPYLKFSAK